MSKLVYGVGLNDADYKVSPIVSGRRVFCQFYVKWKNMLKRCYSKKCQEKYPTYIGCTVTDEWLTFSKFKAWMEQQDWQGKELDKDLLVAGNKVYSPDSCVFVDQMTNSFTTDSTGSRGDCQIGVRVHMYGKFEAQCRNPFSGQREYLGHFDNQHGAHLAWKKRKHELACMLADLQTDDRVANALRLKYADSIRQGDGDKCCCNKTNTTTTKLLPRGRARWLQSQQSNQCLCCHQKEKK